MDPRLGSAFLKIMNAVTERPQAGEELQVRPGVAAYREAPDGTGEDDDHRCSAVPSDRHETLLEELRQDSSRVEPGLGDGPRRLTVHPITGDHVLDGSRGLL